MISNKSISYKITLNRALVELCKKHHLRISKIARDATERELQEKLDRLNKKKWYGKVNRQRRFSGEDREIYRKVKSRKSASPKDYIGGKALFAYGGLYKQMKNITTLISGAILSMGCTVE